MQQLTLALDWTPNINHIGFFVAKAKGFYNELGLEVQIIDPLSDNYSVTPAKKVELGIADFALCPTESVISYQTKQNPFPLKGIATIFQEDVSAIAARSDKQIETPKDLDQKKYASYQARYEDKIVQQLIKNDGGSGELIVEYPAKLGIWDTLIEGAFDATWIFMNWEGVEAQNLDVPLMYFAMKDYGIPYSYSPLIVANERKMDESEAHYESFLSATRRGYVYCQDNSEESIALLKPHLPEKDQKIDLAKALELSNKAFGEASNWGRMKEDHVKEFLEWLYSQNLESQKLEVSDLITNKLL